jgi:hypothetical protein
MYLWLHGSRINLPDEKIFFGSFHFLYYSCFEFLGQDWLKDLKPIWLLKIDSLAPCLSFSLWLYKDWWGLLSPEGWDTEIWRLSKRTDTTFHWIFSISIFMGKMHFWIFLKKILKNQVLASKHFIVDSLIKFEWEMLLYDCRRVTWFFDLCQFDWLMRDGIGVYPHILKEWNWSSLMELEVLGFILLQ